MYTKVNSREQVELFHKGNIINRYAFAGDPSEIPGTGKEKYMDTFEIMSVNMDNDMLELVMTNARLMFIEPGNIGRLFIKRNNLIAENTWWV